MAVGWNSSCPRRRQGQQSSAILMQVWYNPSWSKSVNDADFNWLIENGPRIYEEYAGKWIAVHDGKIIGVGQTAVEADTEARAAQPDGDYILEAVDAQADAIYAGL
jgi:hypothetical protein